MRDETPSTFDGVIFDMGDILYDASVWRRWLTAELHTLGAKITYEELVARWEALLVDVYRGEADYWDRFDELLRRLAVTDAYVADLTAAARRKAVAVQEGRRPMDGVPETLEELRASGVRLAVLSDTESGSESLRRTLGDLGIAACFDAVVASADVGHVKPEPEAFLAAARAIDTDLRQCAFVGHDVDELDGAQRAGLYAVAYNAAPEVPADVRLEHFSELTSVVLGERACL